MQLGSALKFGMLASGEADVYPRHGPTNEWDTAAGQAILEAVGGVPGVNVSLARGKHAEFQRRPEVLPFRISLAIEEHQRIGPECDRLTIAVKGLSAASPFSRVKSKSVCGGGLCAGCSAHGMPGLGRA